MTGEVRISTADLRAARTMITAVALELGAETADRYELFYTASDDAPSIYEGLLSEFEQAVGWRGMFRVAKRTSENIIMTTSAADHALGLWHDIGHVTTGLTFAPADELRLIERQLDSLGGYGLGPTTLEFRLLEATTLGAAVCRMRTGRMPQRQIQFAVDTVERGLDSAIALTTSRKRAASRRSLSAASAGGHL